MHIFSDPKNHALVAGGNLSPNTNINSVLEKMKLNIISNRMRSQSERFSLNRIKILF